MSRATSHPQRSEYLMNSGRRGDDAGSREHLMPLQGEGGRPGKAVWYRPDSVRPRSEIKRPSPIVAEKLIPELATERWLQAACDVCGANRTPPASTDATKNQRYERPTCIGSSSLLETYWMGEYLNHQEWSQSMQNCTLA
jgi:hypothetical protein